MRAYHRSRRDKAIRRFSSEVSREHSPSRVRALTAGMLNRFGGVDGFARAWTETIDAARPGTATRLRAHLAIMRLIAVCDQPEPDLADLSDEELEQQTTEGITRLIQSHPELAVHAAQRLGWTVTPPSEAVAATSVLA